MNLYQNEYHTRGGEWSFKKYGSRKFWFIFKRLAVSFLERFSKSQSLEFSAQQSRSLEFSARQSPSLLCVLNIYKVIK